MERQRQAKLAAKSDKKITKATGQTAAAEEETKVEKEKKKRKGSIAEEEASAKQADENQIDEAEALRLRKFLEDGCEFRGLAETAMAILKKQESRMMKLKPLAKTIEAVFRLSEDYDSDESDIEDDLKWLTSHKKIRRKLKKIDLPKLSAEGKHMKLTK